MWGRYKALRERPSQWSFDVHQLNTKPRLQKLDNTVLLRTQYKPKQVRGMKPDQQTISIVRAVTEFYQFDKGCPDYAPFGFLSWSKVSILDLFPVRIDKTFSYSQQILRLSSYFPESRCAPHSWPFLCFPTLSLRWYMGASKRKIPMNPYEIQVPAYIFFLLQPVCTFYVQLNFLNEGCLPQMLGYMYETAHASWTNWTVLRHSELYTYAVATYMNTYLIKSDQWLIKFHLQI